MSGPRFRRGDEKHHSVSFEGRIGDGFPTSSRFLAD
jgi:hypothetical protein